MRSAIDNAMVDVEHNIRAWRSFRWKARIAKFPEPLPNAVNAVSASGGNKDAIGRRPAQLFINFKRDRFETFNTEWICITSARAEDGAGIVIASLEQLPQQHFLIAAANYPGSI